MTNLYTKAVVIAISALFITLTSCKKDDETYASFTLATSSLDFEWGQAKEIDFSAKKIKTYNTPTFPTGWKCTRSGSAYIIDAPSQSNTSAESSGTIEISVVTDSGSTLTRKIAVAVKMAEEITRMANSIIVSEPGKRFKFNARRRGSETTESITGAAKATRLWSTSKTAVINISLEDGYLYFATGNADGLEEANTLVAVTDDDGNVLWSWHVWVTDFNPADEPDIMGGFRVMNRNLGAFTNSNASAEDAARSYGLYYQWGRKDPFVGPIAWNSTTPVTLYNSSNRATTHAYAIASNKVDTNDDGKNDSFVGTMEYAMSHPNVFIAGDKDNDFDWLHGSHNTGLWGASAKTVNDPCPVGWKVAPPTIWTGFTTTGGASTESTEFNIEGDYKYGWTFINGQGTVFFPAAGRRSFSPTLANSSDNFTNVINNDEEVGFPVGFYWSSTHPAPTTPVIGASSGSGVLVFRHDYISPARYVSATADYAPAGGFPLRCVAE